MYKGQHLQADEITGTIDSQARALGNAKLTLTDGEVSANEITYDFQTGEYAATGDVIVKYESLAYGTIQLSAEVVTGNVPSGRVQAERRPHLQTPRSSLVCDVLTYNRNNGDFTAVGSVSARYFDQDNQQFDLVADRLEGNTRTNDIRATGHPALSSKEFSLHCNELMYNLQLQEVQAVGDCVISSCSVRDENVRMTASNVSGNLRTGQIQASERVFLTQGNGRSFAGDSAEYNLHTDDGVIKNASAVLDGIHFRGSELRAEEDQYVINQSRFTTCDKEDNPHYYVSARQIRIEPGNNMTVRHASVHILGSDLLVIPKYRVDLKDSSRKGMKLPAVGMNSYYGPYVSYEFDISNSRQTFGGLAIRLSEKQALQGGILYDQIASRPVFFRFTYREPFYSGSRRDILLTRLPEAGIRFCSGPDAQRYALSRRYIDLAGETVSPGDRPTSKAKLNVVSEIGVGRFREEPSRARSARLDARTVAWLEPLCIGSRVLFSPGVSGRISLYEHGDTYSALAVRLATSYEIYEKSYVSFSYIANTVYGNSPFAFDNVDLKQELVGKLVFPVGMLNLELKSRYDLRNRDVYDTEITV
ncbi:MAG: hypothetical protein ACPL7O_05350, partial [Armatimonadota bacterium]